MQEVRLRLGSVIQEDLIQHLKAQTYLMIKDSIAREIKTRVQCEVLDTFNDVAIRWTTCFS